MYKGKIIEKDIYNHASVAQNGRAEFINKYKNDIFEVNMYIMKENNNFFFDPPQDHRSVKTYYIIEGEILNYDTEHVYSSGDMIVLDSKSEPFNFHVNTLLKVLVQSVYDNSYEKSNTTFHKINETLKKIQGKDAYTSEHSDRVYKLTRMVAVELNYTGKKLRNILHAAKYHDVGKICIDDAILNKPLLLSNDEFEIMKTHVVKGKDLIMACFNEEVFKIASQHHERIDGSGYPLGITGDQISEEGKIIAICDSFDAMTTDRIYKKGKTLEEAAKELRELRGTKYDSHLVDLFLENVLPDSARKLSKEKQ